jgi:hypothetical protein
MDDFTIYGNTFDKSLENIEKILKNIEKMALDFVGPITPMSKKKRYILVCTDYVDKWVDFKPPLHVIEKLVVDFLFEDIFTHFGVPREIVIDQGT